MKKIFQLVIFLFFAGLMSLSVKAQVTIGQNVDPHEGAILDLRGKGNSGLVMPQVELTEATIWMPLEGKEVDGMVVFNKATSTEKNGLHGRGLYVWVNGSWNLMGVPLESVTSTPVEAKAGINGDLGNEVTLTSLKDPLIVKVVNGTPPYKYVWKKTDTATSSITIIREYTSANNTDNCSITDDGLYTCEVSNAAPTPSVVRFTVSCEGSQNIKNIADYNSITTAHNAISAGLKWGIEGPSFLDVTEGTPTFVSQGPYTVKSNVTVTDIKWYILDGYNVCKANKGNVVISANSLTVGDNIKTKANVKKIIDDDKQAGIPVAIYVYAFITLTKGDDTYKVMDILVTNFGYCDGAVIKKGAYNESAAGINEMEGNFSADWVDDIFTENSKDLCWAKLNIDGKHKFTPAGEACTGGWRLPSLQESHKLYLELGGTGANSDATKFTGLKAPNSAAIGMDNMQEGSYWCGNTGGFGKVNAYFYCFDTDRDSGIRGYGLMSIPRYVRCVKELD